jgi:hypothetical protein
MALVTAIALQCITRFVDVDIKTGRLYWAYAVGSFPFPGEMSDSAITKQLPPAEVARTRPEWHRSITYQLFPVLYRTCSLHAFFHAAGQAGRIETLWNRLNASDAVRRKTARHILALWQAGETSELAELYLFRLQELSDGKPDLDFLEDLEEPSEHKVGDRVIRTYCFPDGQPLERVEGYLEANGKFVRDGMRERWLASGKRGFRESHRRGQKHGRKLEWDEDGKLRSISTYVDDQLVSYQRENLDILPTDK